MTPGVVLAGLAGGAAVLAAWNAILAVEGSQPVARLARALAPLVRARREGRDPTPAERRRLALLGAGALLAGGWLIGGPRLGVALAAGGPWAALAAVRARRRRYDAELERGAPALARALADALAGGHSVRGALTAAAQAGGVGGAAGAELRAAAGRLALGEPTGAALERLRARAGARAVDTIVAAIRLQARAGGDLARLLRGVAGAVEDAVRLEGDARAATAQARFTGFVVTTLPLGAAGLAELASPGYAGRLLSAPLTGSLLVAAALLQGVALLVIQRLARVRA